MSRHHTAGRTRCSFASSQVSALLFMNRYIWRDTKFHVLPYPVERVRAAQIEVAEGHLEGTCGTYYIRFQK